MKALLYKPGEEPIAVSTEGLTTPGNGVRFATVSAKVPQLLECHESLVDVLACGEGYAVYSIFDNELEPNPGAMSALDEITGELSTEDEDNLLRGPILFVDNRQASGLQNPS